MSNTYNLCIVGGGASGLAAAIYIKQKRKDISVAVLERLPRVGKKLITTGNGRCNITNLDESIYHYHGENSGFAEYALSHYTNKELSAFFESIGVPFCCDESGRVYPASLQAASVVDALRFACTELGVDTYTECKVNDVNPHENGYILKTEKGAFFAENVIFAAGLYSGGVRLGCDGSALKLLSLKGIKTVKTTPAIVQIKTQNDITRSLKGIKVNAAATLKIGGKAVRREVGEVLFCDYGLSGPPVLQIAREIERQGGNKVISLDIMPDKSESEVKSLLLTLKQALSYRKLDEFLSGAVNKRVGQAVIKSAGLKLSTAVSDLTERNISTIAERLKSFDFTATGTTGFDNSQVTAGGLDTGCFDSKTMMSKQFNNLYAIGEILDIDGDCGGYNLHFAFSSAFCAADSIIKEQENDKT